MKPGDRSRCIRYKANYGTVMPGNKLELCTFAARMPRMPHKTGSSGFILGEYGNARQRCEASASCRASVERVKNAPTSQLKTIGGKKHGSNSENQNQVKGL